MSNKTIVRTSLDNARMRDQGDFNKTLCSLLHEAPQEYVCSGVEDCIMSHPTMTSDALMKLANKLARGADELERQGR